MTGHYLFSLNSTSFRKWRNWSKAIVKNRNFTVTEKNNLPTESAKKFEIFKSDDEIFDKNDQIITKNKIYEKYHNDYIDKKSYKTINNNLGFHIEKNEILSYHKNIYNSIVSLCQLHALSRTILKWRRFAKGARVYYSEKDFFRSEGVDLNFLDSDTENFQNYQNLRKISDPNDINKKCKITEMKVGLPNNENFDNRNEILFPKGLKSVENIFYQLTVKCKSSLSPHQRSAMLHSRHKTSCRILSSDMRIRSRDETSRIGDNI